MKEIQATNPQLIQLTRLLKKESREKNANIWRDVADYLSKPRSLRVAVNLSRINRNTEESDVIVVPGKILGAGSIDHAVTIAAFSVSGTALEKLKNAKATYLSIPELLEKNPDGSNIKIIR